jgi:FkbM family methyltransferase
MNLQTIIKRLLGNQKSRFLEICSNNKIQLDFESNKDALDVFFNIFYEREYADYFPFYQKANIIDIGAHHGYFSMFSAVNTAKDSKIVAIEPDSENFNRLVQNVKHNSLPNIESISCAIAGEDGQSEFFPGNGVNSTIVANYALSQSGAISKTIETRTLAKIIEDNNLPRVDFLKMDCEGAEYQILINTPSEVFDKIETISMEFHDMKDVRYTGESILNILTQNGFKIVKYHYDKSTRGLNYGKIIGTKK